MSQTATYELTTQGGATDFGRLIDARESFGLYWLIGGLAATVIIVTEGWPTAIRIGAEANARRTNWT